MEVPMAEALPPPEDSSSPKKKGISPADESPPPKKGVSPVAIIGIIVLGLCAVLVIGLWLLPDPWLARARDVSIAFMSIGIFLCLLLLVFILAVIVWGFERLSRRLDDLLQRGGAILDQVKGTATTVKGTTEFVGERVASPFIRLSAWVTGVGKGLATFFRGEKRTGGPNERKE
jgi:hypothetical protein